MRLAALTHWNSFLVAIALVMPASPLFAGGPSTLKLGKIELRQNGSGYRKKGPLTLYESGLYLQQPSHDANAIIAADAAMAIRIEITSGFVSQQMMVNALDEGFRNATGGNTAALEAQIGEFRKCFGDSISKGDVFVLSYIPGAGILVHKNSRQKGLIAGADFKQAVFGIWLSSRPADESLKSAMLGN
jgi:hypothetical protein